MKKLFVLDTTLRDGLQAQGISFSLLDRIATVKLLDGLGIDYIECGNPFYFPQDGEFYEELKDLKLSAKLVSFGATRRAASSVCEDESLNALSKLYVDTVTIFGKASAYQATEILGISKKENLKMIKESVNFLTERGKTVFFDAEHFFDGYFSDPDYALETLKAANDGGAKRLILCDTTGGRFPDDIERFFSENPNITSDYDIGVHMHNDGGLADANTITAVQRGASMMQGTLLGFGERCGNANLINLIANLELKRDYDCIPMEKMTSLYSAGLKLAETANITVHKNQPYIGAYAFAHKAGTHIGGVLKSPDAFEHIAPELIGNRRKILLSDQAGKSAVKLKLKSFFPSEVTSEGTLEKITKELKLLESEGYVFEGAEASFILRVMSLLGKFSPSFELINYKVINEQPSIEGKVASAIIKIRVNGKTRISASDGYGPVHALDLALRGALAEFYPSIKNISLKDYKVRVLDSGQATGSKVRVLITTGNDDDVWTTVGVSDDIIEASYIALVDGIEYALINL